MARPLIISDCDEVLMHMVVPFGAWLADDHDIDFKLEDATFGNALKRRACGTPLEAAEVWPLLDGFFRHEMHRQTAIPGAVEAMNRLSAIADIVILTNVGPDHQEGRVRQLAEIGLHHRVIGSRGPKGDPVAALLAEMQPSLAVFIDDLPQHHSSVAAVTPDVWRLHMVGEPVIAPKIPAARRAHARIDDWASAESWLHARLSEGLTAPAIALPEAADPPDPLIFQEIIHDPDPRSPPRRSRSRHPRRCRADRRLCADGTGRQSAPHLGSGQLQGRPDRHRPCR